MGAGLAMGRRACPQATHNDVCRLILFYRKNLNLMSKPMYRGSHKIYLRKQGREQPYENFSYRSNRKSRARHGAFTCFK